MKLQKKIEEIKFTDCDVWGTVMPVSENIVMAIAGNKSDLEKVSLNISMFSINLNI